MRKWLGFPQDGDLACVVDIVLNDSCSQHVQVWPFFVKMIQLGIGYLQSVPKFCVSLLQ